MRTVMDVEPSGAHHFGGLRPLREEKPTWAHRFEGKRHDAGDKLGFLKATVGLSLKRDRGAALRAYPKSLPL